MMEPQEAQPDVSGCADLNAETSAPRLGHEGTADGIAEPSVLEIECCFFRAKPSRLRLAKKLGKIPVLHLALKTNDGLLQAMEFIGIHQRRYFEEDHTSDAIARNLVESLLKVALEFVLHPSRTRYAKERLVLRECSTSAEVRKNRDVLLLGMVSQLKRINDTIQHVHIEFCDGWSRQQHAARSKKDRSFLILDEDILKIAPMRRELAKAPSARGAFRGLGQGFLNSEKIRRRGLVDELRPHNGGDTSSASSSSTHTEPHQGATTSKSGEASSKHLADADRAIGAESTLIASIKPSERTRINDTPENTAGPPAIETTLEERRRLVLGGVDVTADKVELLPGDVMRSLHSPAVTGDADRAAAPAASDGSATAIVANSISAEGCLSSSAIALDAAEEEEVDELLDEPPPTLSELANRLFGSELEINVDAASDEGAGHLTESTKTPSPKASSRGGGAPSERSEPVTEDSADTFEHTEKPAAGIRWLQQRRKERGNAAASSSDAANTGSNQQAATPSPQSDPSDDLVSLWMKQRW